MSLPDVLKGFGDMAGGLAGSLSGPAKTAAQIVSIALTAGASFAAAGLDPVVHVKRLLDPDDALKKVEDGWKSELDRKFGPSGPGDGG